jgi:hypothetical protein
LLAPRQTPKLEDHPLSAVRDCLFNTFAATLRICRTSIRNLRMRHAVVTRDPLNMRRLLLLLLLLLIIIIIIIIIIKKGTGTFILQIICKF